VGKPRGPTVKVTTVAERELIYSSGHAMKPRGAAGWAQLIITLTTRGGLPSAISRVVKRTIENIFDCQDICVFIGDISDSLHFPCGEVTFSLIEGVTCLATANFHPPSKILHITPQTHVRYMFCKLGDTYTLHVTLQQQFSNEAKVLYGYHNMLRNVSLLAKLQTS